MNPLKELQLLRDFINSNDTQMVIHNLRKALKSNQTGVDVRISDNNAHLMTDQEATAFLKSMIHYYEDLLNSFPLEAYDGSMDFVCRLDNGEYALVETQIIRANYWDKRALAYIAAFYGNQLRKGSDWNDIKRVIGVNILGGGKHDERHWIDTPHQFMRHYMFEEQIHKEPRYIQELQLFQYSIQNEPQEPMTMEQKEWLLFFKNGHHMTENDVAALQTDAVKQAFKRAQFQNMPAKLRKAYEDEDIGYDRYSDVMHEREEKGVLKGIELGREEGIELGRQEERRHMVLNCLNMGCDDAFIMAAFKITQSELNDIKESVSSEGEAS